MTNIISNNHPSPKRHRPWQFDWKRPQWQSVENNTEDLSHLIVVGLTTAQISLEETRRILGEDETDSKLEAATTSQDDKLASLRKEEVFQDEKAQSSSRIKDDDDSRYLLSVSLLAPKPPPETSIQTQSPPASEVLLEIIDTRPDNVNGDSSAEIDTHTSSAPPPAAMICSKRLTWPETAIQQQSTPKNKKNIFSVFKPLFGIDEEDGAGMQMKDEETATRDSASTFVSPNPNACIVSATFCRRPQNIETTNTSHQNSSATDVIQLMNLGMPTTTEMKDDTNNTGESSNHGSVKLQPSPTSSTPGDLFLVCISTSGKVYVYDPWQLLQDGSEDSSTKKPNTSKKDDDDDVSKLFLGNDLFQTLQETWKPLSEPVATIRLSVFEHDHRKKNREQGTSAPSSNPQHNSHHGNDDDSVSVLSASSLSQPDRFQLGCPPPSPASARSSILSKNPPQSGQWAQHNNPHHHHHHSRKPLVDPFLWNPLLEQSTLIDRTHSNTPLAVNVAGDSYLIVTGKGTPYGSRRKKLRAKLRQLEQQRRFRPPSRANSLQRNEAPLGSDGSAAARPTDKASREWWESSRSLSERLIQESKRKKNRTRLDSSQHGDSVASSVTSASAASHRHSQSGDSSSAEGGFVTFISLGRWSESRTLFLPFVPASVSRIQNWNGMELVMVLGQTESILIRIDANGPLTVPTGTTPTSSAQSPSMDSAESPSGEGSSPTIVVKRFQLLPVENSVSQTSVPRRLLCGSESTVQPPSLLELYLDFEDSQSIKQSALVLSKTLSYCNDRGAVVLHHDPSHFAKIPLPRRIDTTYWARHGQGWSLLGAESDTFIICWEGSNSTAGSYVQQLPLVANQANRSMASISQILPLRSISIGLHSALDGETLEGNTTALDDPTKSPSAMVPLPFSTPYQKQALSRNSIGDFKMDVDAILQVMSDLSRPYGQQSQPSDDTSKSTSVSDRRKLARMSHMQRSERLLQHCSSWTQLQESLDDRVVLERQEPLLNLRVASTRNSSCLLTLRQLVVNNRTTSPFQQVLAWLAKDGDFFTASSVALDLLQDGETLYSLWRNADMIDEQEEESKLSGLLDGIAPIRIVDQHDRDNKSTSVNVVHLADMTVGCLIKAGYTMADTLRKFLNKNEFYDPSRACLMLAATTARAMGDSMEENNTNQLSDDEVLWPVKCLLEIGVARDYLDTALLLLNVTIPDELRHRNHHSDVASLRLSKRLIAMIVESNSAALDLLLDLVDEETGLGYWKSLDHETQLDLSLTEIQASFPLIQNPEIRAWVREELNLCLMEDVKLPTLWLQKLTFACLKNSGCDLIDFEIEIDASSDSKYARRSSSSEIGAVITKPAEKRAGRGESMNLDENDGLSKLQVEIYETRNALISSSNGYGIDNDILIPSLLLLKMRKTHWLPEDHERFGKGNFAPAQALLDAACYLAGRRPKGSAVILTAAKKQDTMDEKPFLFADFDSTTAMKQCYMAGNISAGANLVGGKIGFVLHLCQILHEVVKLSIRDAQTFVVSDDLDVRPIEDSGMEMSSFDMSDGHWKLLWMLNEHVLSVKTFGEFETVHIRGRVDPVFAARSIFRSWLALSYGDKRAASNWLSQWLRRRLKLGRYAVQPGLSTPQTNGSSQPRQEDDASSAPVVIHHHRLACAAIARSLVWPSTMDEDLTDTDSSILATAMEFEATFIIEICEACIGLVESVPPEALKETKSLAY